MKVKLVTIEKTNKSIQRLLLAAALYFSLGVPNCALAVYVSYDYTFNTPVFADPPFAPLNALLSAAGPTITGAISFDTDDVTAVNVGGLDRYETYTHVGELDAVGFDSNSSLVTTLTGTIDLDEISAWTRTIGTTSYEFEIDFNQQNARGICTESGTAAGCGGFFDVFVEIKSLTGYNLTRTAPVPEPTTLLLSLIGIAGIGFSRSFRT